MRTTLNIEDEALSALRKYAEKRKFSMGRAASDLILLGAEALPKFKMKNGFALLELPPGSPPLTLETLKKWENEDFEDEYRRAMSPRR